MLISLVLKNSLIGKSRGLQTCSSHAGEPLSLPRAIRSSSEDTAEQSRPTSQHPKCPSCKSLSSFPLCPTATAPLTCPRAASPGERPPALLPFFSLFPLLGSCLLSAAASYCLLKSVIRNVGHFYTAASGWGTYMTQAHYFSYLCEGKCKTSQL